MSEEIADVEKFKPTGFGEQIFKQRYAIHPEETWDEACRRVAKCVASAETTPENRLKYEEIFYKELVANRFIGGGRIMYGSGRPRPALVNCFVLNWDIDSRELWSRTLGEMLVISGLGGGVGINGSGIRPRGTPIHGVGGTATGAVSFMELVNSVGDVIKGGGGRRCFSADTLILTDKGWVSVQEIVESHENFKAWTHKDYRPIVNKFENGTQEVFKVTLSSGYEIKTTANHKFLILNEKNEIEKIELSELNTGDSVLLAVAYPNDTADKPLKLKYSEYVKPKGSTTLRDDLKLPESLEEKLAYFLGLSYADGSVEADKLISIALHPDEEDIIDYIKTISMDLFNIEPTVRNGDGCKKVTLYSRELIEWLRLNGLLKEKADKIKVPDLIMRSPYRVMASFIAGFYDGDGCYTTSKCSIDFNSISESFIKDLQLMLSSLTILSRKAKTVRPNNWKTMHRLHVRGAEFSLRFKRIVGPFSFKVRRFENFGGGRDHTWYHNFSVIQGKGWSYEGLASPQNTNGITYSALCRVAERNKVHPPELDYVPDEIISIEYVGFENTYCVEVKDEHALCANGFYVSNSALMLCLNIDHPDLLEFIDKKFTTVDIDFSDYEQVRVFAREKLKYFSESYLETFKPLTKTKEGQEHIKQSFKAHLEKNLANANVSVVFNDDPEKFFEKVRNKEMHEFVWKGQVVSKIRADKLWDKIISNGLAQGEPGILNMYLANKYSNMRSIEPLVSSNPCGEVPLSPNEICCLGQLVLPKFVTEDGIDWAKLAHAIDVGIRFLDNVLDVTVYPTEAIKEKSSKTRRIGLGIIGLADMLLMLDYKYSSERGRNFAAKVMEFIKNKSYEASSMLAIERGSFQYYNKKDLESSEFISNLKPSVRYKVLNKGLRNVAVNSIAPTGTTSIVCGASSSIEPIMGPAYKRTYWVGDTKETEVVVHPLFENFVNQGKDVSHFESSEGVSTEDHFKMQVAIQSHVDMAIAKTVNLYAGYTKEEFSEHIMKYLPQLKGVTVYPVGSRGASPIIPLSVEEAIKIVEEKIGRVGTSEEQETQDCPSGICTLG